MLSSTNHFNQLTSRFPKDLLGEHGNCINGVKGLSKFSKETIPNLPVSGITMGRFSVNRDANIFGLSLNLNVDDRVANVTVLQRTRIPSLVRLQSKVVFGVAHPVCM